jgi:hypothetical protein
MGPTGPTGITGITGPTGIPGATGTSLWTINSNNQYFNNGVVSIGRSDYTDLSFIALDVSGSLNVSKHLFSNNPVNTLVSSPLSDNITLDYSRGSTFIFASGSVSADYSCNITNLPILLDTSRVYTIVLMNTISPLYKCSTININSSNITNVFFNSATITASTVTTQVIQIFYVNSSYYAISNIICYNQ